MFRARLARVYWFSPLGRTSRWRIFGYGPDAYLVSWSYRRTYAGGNELGVLSWDGSWAFLGAPRVSSALSLVPSRHFVSLGADGGCFSGGTSCLLGPRRGSLRPPRVPWDAPRADTGGKLFGTRVRQGGFYSRHYLLHFRESRWQMRRVYVGLTPRESYMARE